MTARIARLEDRPAPTPAAWPSPVASPAVRVLILTAGYGEGHNAAARALAHAIDASEGAGAAHVADLFALASPRLNAVGRRMYLHLINHLPHVWSWMYRRIDRSPAPQRFGRLFWAECRTLQQLLERERPAAVCCTYPVHAFLLNRLAAIGVAVPPVYNVVTDSISIHSLWWRARCSGWFLPNADSADVLLRAGISPAAVHVSGFPVPAFFGDNRTRLFPPDLAHGATPRVLQIIHSGTRNAEEIARRLLTETTWDVTLAVGRDLRLKARLARLAAGRGAPVRLLGWTGEIPFLLMTRHAVVSKAGGATTQEAIAALCPMIVTQVVPGQEEGNFELLRRHGAGQLAGSPGAVLAALRALFAESGREWRQCRESMRRLGRPDAAHVIARAVLRGTASGQPAEVTVPSANGTDHRAPTPTP